MTPAHVSRWTSLLGGTLGGLYLVLGVAEGAVRVDQPAPLLFWLPALWGGSALVLAGVFRSGQSAGLSLALVVVGVLVASLATAWTVLLPAFGIALIVLVAVRGGRPAPA